MSDEISTHILFVEDVQGFDEDQLRQLFIDHRDVSLRHRDPEEVTRGDLHWADLVIVDFFVDDWAERDDSPPSRSPADGLAVIGNLRSSLNPDLRSRQAGQPQSEAIAFALLTGNMTEASFNLPDVLLPHAFARTNGIEWAFRRASAQSGDLASQAAALGEAVARFGTAWRDHGDDGAGSLMNLLGLDGGLGDSVEESPWLEDARRSVIECRPPIHEIGDASQGMASLRWILHRILPYPCFLMDARQVACRLRIEEMPSDSELIAELSAVRYSGVLANFLGPRWWRSGVEEWLYTATEGFSGDARAVRTAALNRGGVSLREWRNPVLTIDRNLARDEDFTEVEEAVRVLPDDWPPFAESAFVSIDLAREDSEVRSWVSPNDAWLLESPSVSDGSP